VTLSLHRWHLKKTARKAVMLGSLASSSIALRRLMGATRVRAITYHRFGHVDRDPWCVAPPAFEEQMRWLAAERLAVSLDDVLRFARGEAELANGSVLVTMDDGLSSMLTEAAPVLRRYRIPAVAFITTGAIGDPEAGKGAGEEFLTWQQVRELDASGVTIGSHGHTHRSMASLGADEVREEGRLSKALIESHLGKPVYSFAYPFGMRNDESPATAKALAECGYTSLFISQHGTIQAGSSALRLPRIKVEAGEPLWTFKLLCLGGMDAWALADRLL
jgi:peptidoglycan/xylan/chitin deacetylase (PgdA/CDA1 family)